MQPWIEVAPALLISPQKPSSVSKLETISEEGAETEDESPSPSMANQRLVIGQEISKPLYCKYYFCFFNVNLVLMYCLCMNLGLFDKRNL